MIVGLPSFIKISSRYARLNVCVLRESRPSQYKASVS